jgi:hypothetical protein
MSSCKRITQVSSRTGRRGPLGPNVLIPVTLWRECWQREECSCWAPFKLLDPYLCTTWNCLRLVAHSVTRRMHFTSNLMSSIQFWGLLYKTGSVLLYWKVSWSDSTFNRMQKEVSWDTWQIHVSCHMWAQYLASALGYLPFLPLLPSPPATSELGFKLSLGSVY